jgi:hypothetical protein
VALELYLAVPLLLMLMLLLLLVLFRIWCSTVRVARQSITLAETETVHYDQSRIPTG